MAKLDTQAVENDIRFIYDQGGSDADVDNYLSDNKVDHEITQSSTDKLAEQKIDDMYPEIPKPELLDVAAGGTPEEQVARGNWKTGAIQKTGKAMVTPAMHYFNQRAMNVPRQAAEAGGYTYVGDTGNPIIEGVSKIAGAVGGIRTLKDIGKSKIGMAIKPQDSALLKAGKGAVEGAGYMGVYSGAEDVFEGVGKLMSGDLEGAQREMGELGIKLGIGAVTGAVATPVFSKVAQMTKAISKASANFYRKNAAGYSKMFADTLKRLGSARVFDPMKATGEYVSKTLVPKVSKEISRLLTTKSKNRAVELLEYLKLKPEEIDDIISLAPQYKKRLAEGSTKGGYEVFKEVELETIDLGKKIGATLEKYQRKNKMIKVNNTMNTFKKILVEGGYVDREGKITQLAEASTDRTVKQLLQLWDTLNKRTLTPNFRFRTPISVAEYRIFKTTLENMIKSNEAKNIPIYEISRQLVKDVGNQLPGIKGLYSKYNQLMTYKGVWRKLYDKTSPTSIENVLSGLRAANPNQGMNRVIFSERFSNVFGKETMDELSAWIAAQEHQETVGMARGAMRAGFNVVQKGREAVQRSVAPGSKLNKLLLKEFTSGRSPDIKNQKGFARIGKTSKKAQGPGSKLAATVSKDKELVRDARGRVNEEFIASRVAKVNAKKAKGKSWSGVVDLRDGGIEETFTKEQARAADHHHSFLINEASDEGIEAGTKAYFWIDEKGIPQDVNDILTPAIKAKIKKAFLASGILTATLTGKAQAEQLTPNFKREEFNQKQTPLPLDQIKVDPELTDKLEKLRKVIGNKAITITSGYRNPEYNKKVGGVKDSQHLKGKAADIAVKGMSSKELEKFAKEVGFGYVATYKNKPHLHVDVRKKKGVK